jgi:hypothetical protein
MIYRILILKLITRGDDKFVRVRLTILLIGPFQGWNKFD